MKVGEKIKQRRMELGWSLRELAKRMGYANQSTISRIESGAIKLWFLGYDLEKYISENYQDLTTDVK